MFLFMALKLVVGMLGILFFLRISGKTQMAQLTPLDSVNAFVLGALVGGVIYTPTVSVWQLVFSLAVWTVVNLTIRYMLRFRRLRRLIKGDTSMIVRKGAIDHREFRRNSLEMEQFRTMLRENGIFSMFDVEDARFETNGRLTVSRPGKSSESYLLVNEGTVMEGALASVDKDEKWLRRNLKKLGYSDPGRLFCVEWTPGRGFYVSSPDDETRESGTTVVQDGASN